MGKVKNFQVWVAWVKGKNHRGGGELYIRKDKLSLTFRPVGEATHTWKFLTFPNFLSRMPLWKKRFKKIVLPPSEHCRDTQYKNNYIFFALIKKIFLNLNVGYEYIEESFDTIFNIFYGGGASPMGYWFGNRHGLQG